VGLSVLVGAAVVALLVAFVAFRQFRQVPVAYLQFGLLAVYVMVFGARLTREEREKARVKKMFKGYVSDNVVDMLLSSDRRLDLQGQSMHVTVLFSDIRKFTTISEKLTARETVEFLNAYFAKAIAVVLEEGGRIDKFIGDAVMVEFGVPILRTTPSGLRAAVVCVRPQGFRGWMRAISDRDLPDSYRHRRPPAMPWWNLGSGRMGTAIGDGERRVAAGGGQASQLRDCRQR
jgi:hypothetical protein